MLHHLQNNGTFLQLGFGWSNDSDTRSAICLFPSIFFRCVTIGLQYLRRYIGLPHFLFPLSNSFHCSPCTIRSGSFDGAILYDINLGATHTTIPSTRGVEIHISLVSSATDSIRRCVVVFKIVLVPTSDLKSEFLCQSSDLAQNLQTP